MIRKLLLAVTLCFFAKFSDGQTVHEWYQDGIIIFQMKTEVAYNFPMDGAHVDFENVPFIAQLKDEFGIKSMTQKHPNDPDELLRHTYEIHFEMWAKVDGLVAEIQRNAQVDYAEKKDLPRHFLTPNDLGANSANGTGVWHLYTMQAEQAWDITTGDANIIVAVTDDAILTTHVDLQNKLVMPYDAVDNDTDPNPCGSNDGNHGTHVAGIVGAETNNNTGVSSIGFDVSIMPIKIGTCTGLLTSGYEGINYAANNGAQVINMSWGHPNFSNYAQNVCNAAFNQGAVLVAAAGNDGVDDEFYPAANNNVVSVASVNINDQKAGSSQFGTWIDIASPGVGIRSTYANSNTSYSRINGTSMASPNVAGVVGLMRSYVPTASNQQIISCLLSSTDNIDAANPSYVGELGSGRVNALAALQCIENFIPIDDAGIVSVTTPTGLVCSDSISSSVEIHNFGMDPLTSATINFETGGPVSTYSWTGNLAQGQSETVTLPAISSAPGSVTYTAYTTNPNGNLDDNSSNDESTGQVNVFINPNIPVITQVGNTLSVPLGSGETADWTFGGASVGTGASITMTGSGVYQVTVTNAAGCDAVTSETFQESGASVSEIALEQSLLIFPNPTNGSVNVNFQAQEELHMYITDAVGRKVSKVHSYEQGTHAAILDLSSYRTGIYMIVFEAANGTIIRRVTKR